MNFTECWNDTCSSVAVAARLGNIEFLQHFIRENKPVDVSDNRGWKPLHEAAALSPSVLCLEELLKHEATDINWVTHEGETALLLACKRRSSVDGKSVVKLLLQYGADPNIKDNEEDTPLLAAVRNGMGEIVDLLLDAGANVNARDCGRWSALHEAASNNNIYIVRSLLRRGAHIHKKDECGMTPIFTAAQHGAEQSLKELLIHAKLKGQLNVVDIGAEDWATPLMIAAQQGFDNCMKLLLDYGANPDLKTSDQATALHMAVQGNHKTCLDILLKKMNIQPIIASFHPLTYQDGSVSPIHLAVEYSSYDCLQTLLVAGFSPDSLFTAINLPSIVQFLNLPDKETALSFAIFRRNETATAILLKAGASTSPTVDESFHPLLRAMHNPTLQEFYILIEGGTNVNYRRQNRHTNEVFLYCLIANPMFLKSLLYHGCDPNFCFEEGHELFVKCVLYYLRREGYERVVELLHLLLRFLIINRAVQNAVHILSKKIGMLSDPQCKHILEEINQLSSLKQMCFVKLRQHLYSIHGVKMPDVIQQLQLPSILEEYVACYDLKFPPVDEPLIINSSASININ